MKTIIYNSRQLDVIIKDIYTQFNELGELAVDYGKPYKDITKNQLGFIFGALIDSVIEFYKKQGEIWQVEEVKENFYQACSYLDERLRKQVTRFNGEVYQVPKRLSEMDRETTSLFIDKCIYLIDHAKNFTGMYLHPSIRNTWIRHITTDDIEQLRFVNFPRQDKEYLSFEHKEPCMWCGKFADIEVHHLKELGYTGTAYKADDWLSLPLCKDCHIAYHTQGKAEFEKAMQWITKYINLVDFCKLRYNRWKNKL